VTNKEQALKRLKILKHKRLMWVDVIATTARIYGSYKVHEVTSAIGYVNEVDKEIAELEDMVDDEQGAGGRTEDRED